MIMQVKSSLPVAAMIFSAVLLLASCSEVESLQGDASPKLQSASSLCGGLLGEKGSGALEELTGRNQFVDLSGYSPGAAAEGLKKQLEEKWKPRDPQEPLGSGEMLSWGPFNLCTPSVREGGVAKDFISLDVSWSNSATIDELREGRESSAVEKDDSRTDFQAFSIGPDVYAELKESGFYLYFECAVPGASPEQEENLPLMARLSDQWTDKKGRATPARYSRILMPAARATAKSLGCTNALELPVDATPKPSA
ncbi:hypothetical protein ACFW9F_14110 [Streptomyces sp. NPDC059506]|uniref:hypothetical protein n=1 Tax=Streptomyces sp. NPDC059506 TaxID=3347751 RepID=UPI0036C490E9